MCTCGRHWLCPLLGQCYRANNETNCSTNNNFFITKINDRKIFFSCPIIIATTIPTLQYLAAAKKSARRVRGTNPWQGALTTALTAIVYCISAIPISVYFICKTFAGVNHIDILDRHLFRIGMFMTIIQVISNFFVYTLTIKSFRRFLELKVSSVSKSLSTSRRISSNTTIYE